MNSSDDADGSSKMPAFFAILLLAAGIALFFALRRGSAKPGSQTEQQTAASKSEIGGRNSERVIEIGANSEAKSAGIASERPQDDRKAILDLVRRYYTALEKRNYSEAAAYYEANAFDGTGLNPAEALKQATEFLGGLDAFPKVANLKIDGDKASADLMIDRAGRGPATVEMVDPDGGNAGTYARSLRFIKQNGAWKIGKDMGGDYANASQRALEQLRRVQSDIEKRK